MIAPEQARTGLDAVVAAAAAGDALAWEDLVHRMMPVVVSTIGESGLTGADAAEVNQTVWLRVVEWLERLHRPAALPAWIATTTSRECQRVIRTSRQQRPAGLFDDLPSADEPETEALREEQYEALRDGFGQLPDRCRRLLGMLLGEPPMSYRDVVAETGMSIGSVGPTQRRCLDKLRATPALAAYLGTGEGRRS
ncbi:sigma-70 family RNA polymerase sigma factor [Dactylosporangium sp. NPDC005555]|uniref:sigma-70 family RNA polymerase sigma factor n=1 Tax=Dactylosporangium sp. NPDC005555 TaxID=3154889 RepID=UPI0033A6F3F7